MKYKFVIADDHSIVRHGISILIKDFYYDSNVSKLSSFSELIKHLANHRCDLLILDVNFPEGISLNVIPTLKMLQNDLKILIFSAYDEDIYAIRYLNAGANGYLNKLCEESEIKVAIESIFSNGKYISQNIQNKIFDSFVLNKPTNPLEQLSNREIQIAKLLVEGHGNVEISKMLNISKTTASTYKSRLFEKLSINSISSLIHIFNVYHNKSIE